MTDEAAVRLHEIGRVLEHAADAITVDSEPGVGSTFTVRLPMG